MSRNVKELFDLTGRTALVTGGSRGLGLQMAEALGEAGAKVIVSARKSADLEQAVAHLRSRGIEADFIAADASKDADMIRLADDAIARLGRVDILVNNAGASWGAPAEEHPLDGWDKVMNINIRGIFVLSQRIGAKSMLPARYGRVINIASIAGREGTALLAAYCAAKHGVVGLTRALAEELRAAKVSVNAICPGSVDTIMLREGMPGASADMSPDDIARTALFLAHAAPSALTGACIDVYG